jgi:hypothetical protein
MRITVALMMVLASTLSPALAAASSTADTRVAPPERRLQPDRYTLALELGGAMRRGNVEQVAGKLGLAVGLKFTPEHAVFLDSAGDYSEFGETAVLDVQSGALLYAWSPTPHLNVYGYSTHHRSPFQGLDYRTTNSLGVCVHSYWKAAFRVWLLSFGVTPEQEWWTDGATETNLRASVRNDFTIGLSETASISADLTWAPRVDDPGDYRLFGAARLEAKITPDRLSMRISGTLEHDVSPRGAVKRTDVAVIPSLVVKLGG